MGGNRVERLNLHAADPHGILNGASIHPAIRARTQAVLSRARSEGLDLRVVSGFRSVEEQDRLYAQGRTAPGNIVTNARGGSSWHNYGLAIDIAFNDANGQPVWPENANWARYGQIAVAEGLTWGGNFRNFVDRPHIEYHPGLGPGDASTLLALYRQGGLTRVWNHLGYD